MSADFRPEHGPDHLPDGAINPANSSHTKDRQAEAERINREEALYRGGFPVAGHDPGRERTR